MYIYLYVNVAAATAAAAAAAVHRPDVDTSERRYAQLTHAAFAAKLKASCTSSLRPHTQVP
jgi:hypothetical protein